jgi:phosphatidylglycerol:prolipoprotein diacylglycerol transferase
MYPVLFSIGTWELHASDFFLALGLLVGALFGWRQSRRLGYPGHQVLLFLLSVVPFGLLLASLNGLLFWLGLSGFLENLSKPLSGGLVSFGAVLGALFLGWVFARRYRTPPGEVLDLVALTLPLILAIYRIGCLLNGCCYGLETDGSLGMYLPAGPNGVWAPRYPTQIMLIAFNLGLFAWLWHYRQTRPLDGNLTLSFLILYSFGRLLIDALRDLPRVWWLFSPHQLAAIAILVVSGYLWLDLWIGRRRTAR